MAVMHFPKDGDQKFVMAKDELPFRRASLQRFYTRARSEAARRGKGSPKKEL